MTSLPFLHVRLRSMEHRPLVSAHTSIHAPVYFFYFWQPPVLSASPNSYQQQRVLAATPDKVAHAHGPSPLIRQHVGMPSQAAPVKVEGTESTSTSSDASSSDSAPVAADNTPAVEERVADLQAQVEKLTSVLGKQAKKEKKTKVSKKKEKSSKDQEKRKKADKKDKAAKKDKKDKSHRKDKSHHKKTEKSSAASKAAAEKAAAAAKAEKKAQKKAAKAAEAARLAKKEAKKAKKAQQEAPAKTKSSAKHSHKPAGADVTNTSHMKVQSGKKVAKTIPNTTSLTWTSDSSIDILAGQNFCFPIEIADSRPSVLEWTFQVSRASHASILSHPVACVLS